MSERHYFKKASRSQSFAKICITGPSGSGKTYSALLLAKGLGGETGVIDSENNSASLYEDRFGDWEYFTLPINPPYTVQKYIKAINVAIDEGIKVLVIDSLSHVWAAEGGLLQQKEALDSRGGNSYTNWSNITKMYEELKSKILHSPIHIICTLRSKQEYVLEENKKGKQAPRKVGLAPIMRDGMEYEFTTVFDLSMDHQFMVSKDRTDLFDGVVARIDENTGKEIDEWLKKKKDPSNALVSEEKEENEEIANFVISYGDHKDKRLIQLNEVELKKLYLSNEKLLKEIPPVKNVSEVFDTNQKIKKFLIQVECWPINFAEERV